MSDYLELLREKTEEGDLNSILKPNLGGYTKRSVLEYLTFVKKQQQSQRDTYATELQRLQAEKESLQSENARLQVQLQTAEADYRRQKDAEVGSLQEKYAALEKDMDEALERIRADEARYQQLQTEKESETLNAQAARQSASATAALLDSARAQAEELNQTLVEKESELETLREQEQELRAQLAEDRTSDLRTQLEALIRQTSLLEQEIALRDRELENRALRLETLTRQAENAARTAETIQAALQDRGEQLEWLQAENAALGQRLQAQTEETLSLARENARLQASNGIFRRRLEAAELRGKDEVYENGI